VKKFTFPLDRVLAWRRTQARIEQTKLEKLQQQLRDMDARIGGLASEENQARQMVIRSPARTGADLSAFDLFKRACSAQVKAIEKDRGMQEGRIREQQRVLALKERDVKLLEKLREQKLAAWRYEHTKEIDSQAEESYLARWRKDVHRE